MARRALEIAVVIFDDITLELARIERLAHDAVRKRMSERQLGEAWADLAEPSDTESDTTGR